MADGPPRTSHRIAVNVGGDYVAGTDSIVAGLVSAAHRFGWEVVGIRDGFDGLLFPDRYAGDGLVTLGPDFHAEPLGNATRTDPFRVQRLTDHNEVVEIDSSDDLLAAVRREKIDAVVSIVDHGALSLLFRLATKGLRSICIPKSVENDMPATTLSFGFNTALGYTVETLDRAAAAAKSTGTIGVVEVLGARAGWLAVQSALAVQADAVLIPEIPYELTAVGAALRPRLDAEGYGLVVVAEGARPVAESAPPHPSTAVSGLKACLSPMATGNDDSRVIRRSGAAADGVARELQKLTNHKTYPLVLGELSRAGSPSATDRQLGLAYGAAAVQAVRDDVDAAMVVFDPPALSFLPLRAAINNVRRLSPDHVLMDTARAVGISLGGDPSE